jgi:predicted outer membrane repeat protein
MNTSMKTTPVLVCVALLSVGCGDAALDETQDFAEFRALEDGLLLHWTFEDRSGNQVLDVSGNNRHGTLQGGGTFVSSPVGEAVSLDGVDDWVSLVGPRDPALYGGITGNFTISARVRVGNVGKYNTLCYGCGPFATMYVGTPIYGARSMSGLFNKTTSGVLWPWTTQSLSNDTWVDVTMVVEGGVKARHYLDCAYDSEFANVNIGLKNYGSSSFGRGANASAWFDGEVDELRIWDRALTDAEIASICPPAPGLCDAPIKVDVDAALGGDGLSWATAFNNLQVALDAAAEAECTDPEFWVAEGTYAPDPAQPVAAITQPVSLYGGFAGTETLLAERDVVAHPTRLGADGWDARVVVLETGALEEGQLLVLDGFTISGSDAGAIEVQNTLLEPWGSLTASFRNLVITDNSAVKGAGFSVFGFGRFEIVDSHVEGNVASEAGAAIWHDNVWWDIEGSSFIANNSPGATISQYWEFGMSHGGYHQLTDCVMSNNVGGVFRGPSLSATDTEFSGNTATYGGALRITEGGLSTTNCQFIGNTATNYGGAIYFDNADIESHQLVDTEFSNNTAKWGGAIYLVYFGFWKVSLDIEGGEFVNNTATLGGGGAIFMQESNTTIAGTVFADNTAAFGGAIHVDNADSLSPTNVAISGSRFIANEATGSGGGGILLEEPITVTDSEFVANTAATGGGGVFGRANLVGVTFANNLAPSGKALYAPAGGTMTLRNVVAWPDNLVAANMHLDRTCIPKVWQAFTSDGHVVLVANPFDAADLDLDGRTEFYLDPSSACVDIGGTVSEFDWASETTQASQCTDVTPVDAGIHYTPLSAAGPC